MILPHCGPAWFYFAGLIRIEDHQFHVRMLEYYQSFVMVNHTRAPILHRGLEVDFDLLSV